MSVTNAGTHARGAFALLLVLPLSHTSPAPPLSLMRMIPSPWRASDLAQHGPSLATQASIASLRIRRATVHRERASLPGWVRVNG